MEGLVTDIHLDLMEYILYHETEGGGIKKRIESVNQELERSIQEHEAAIEIKEKHSATKFKEKLESPSFC